MSIFIERDLPSSNVTFVEDFLHSIYLQLGSTSLKTQNHYEHYERACQNGESMTKRLKLLRLSLYSQLDGHNHSFLVLDGYDRLGEELQALIDGELSRLQSHRLRVLQTRRVPIYDIPLYMGCDGLDCENPHRLNLFWVFLSLFTSFLYLLTQFRYVRHVSKILPMSTLHSVMTAQAGDQDVRIIWTLIWKNHMITSTST